MILLFLGAGGFGKASRFAQLEMEITYLVCSWSAMSRAYGITDLLKISGI
jgi:hypothetical protein